MNMLVDCDAYSWTLKYATTLLSDKSLGFLKRVKLFCQCIGYYENPFIYSVGCHRC